MQEFWFCTSCKSMNRGSSEACYHCHAPKATSTLHTVAQRAPGVVLTPELDDEHREVAWALMVRNQYTSAWQLGYVAAGLLLVFTLAFPVLAILQVLSLTSALPPAMTPSATALGLVTVAFGALGLVAVVLHSVFLGLTTLNTPALGGGTPRFEAVRAGLWWIESYLWAIRGALAFTVPAFLAVTGILLGGIIFGLIIGAVWFALAVTLLGDPIVCLSKPGRLLEDLWLRLALRGSPDMRIVSWWTMAWGVSQGFAYAVSALTYLFVVFVVLVSIFAGRFGFDLGLIGPGQNDTFVALLGVFVGGTGLVASGTANLLLVRITIELSSRQRAREKWVLSGVTATGGERATLQPAALASAGTPAPTAPAATAPPSAAPVAAQVPTSPAADTAQPAADPNAPAAEAAEPGSGPNPEQTPDLGAVPARPAPPIEKPRWLQAQAAAIQEAKGSDRRFSGLRIQRRPVSATLPDGSPRPPSEFERALAQRQAARQSDSPEPAAATDAPASEPGTPPASEPAPESRPLPSDADWPEGL